MLNKKQEIIERLRNELGLNGLFTKKLDYGLDYEDVTEEVISKIEKAIDDIYDDIDRDLPEKRPIPPYTDLNQTYEQNVGYNQCLSLVKQIIKSKK